MRKRWIFPFYRYHVHATSIIQQWNKLRMSRPHRRLKAALTADLRAGGAIRRRRTRAQVAEAERVAQEDWDERHTRARRSRRLQGEGPEEEGGGRVSSSGEESMDE